MKTRTETTRIIWHHTVSGDVSAETIDKWHRERGFAQIGYHYLIRFGGTRETGRDIRLVGAHAKGRNHDSIGVAVCGDFDKHYPQYEQLVACKHLYHQLSRIFGVLKNEFHSHVLTLPNQYSQKPFYPCPGRLLDRVHFIKEMEASL